MNARPEQLSGPTYKLVLEDSTRMYVTINEHEGQPFEIFVRNDDPKLYEWIAAITILISRLLRQGESLGEIGKELEQIHGPESRHMIPGTNIQSPSMIARVGRTLRLHTTTEEITMDCNTGELFDRSTPENDAAFKKRFEELTAKNKKLLSLSERQHEELKPIGSNLRKGYMRNRLCPCGSNKKFKRCCWSKFA